MSPEEDAELDLRVKLCGYQTRQEYIIESVFTSKGHSSRKSIDVRIIDMIAADEDRLERVRDNIDAAENEYVKYADMITDKKE